MLSLATRAIVVISDVMSAVSWSASHLGHQRLAALAVIVKKLTSAGWLGLEVTPIRRRPCWVVCIIEHDHADRGSVLTTASKLALIQNLLHGIVCSDRVCLINDKGCACIVLSWVNPMATLCHLRNLNHAKRVHHVVLSATDVFLTNALRSEHHLVAVRVVLVDRLLLT